MQVCARCIQPDSRPGIYFNDAGVCGACLWEDEKKLIDWQTRENELMAVAEKAQARGAVYDCVIGVSGGKDSTKQALTARDRMGLNCLLVNSEAEGITEIGTHNIENLKQLGFDVLALRPNPATLKKMMKFDFYRNLNPVKITEYSLWSSAYIVADRFDIPLIIQGENQGLTLGTSKTGLGTDDNALKTNEQDTLSSDVNEYLQVDGVTEKDLFLFQYDRKRLEEKGVRGIWLQYYLEEWSYRGNAEFSRDNGMRWRDDDFDLLGIGTHMPFAQLDSDLVQVNQMLKYVKFGFGQCMDHACYDLREGLINRDEAIALVRKYDGQCGDQYIESFCKAINISVEEFWKVTNSYRGDMFKQEGESRWVNTVWDLYDNS